MQKNPLTYRKENIEKLSQHHFDVLVVGGGITGAGIALDAISRGMTVALIEMQDFAAGTSGRSTKLIHGGLRYLKQWEFKLVAEVGAEREIIHSNAPHLTHAEKMMLPITKKGSLGKFSTRIAMWIYEWLAGVKKEEWHRVLNKREAITTEPLLDKNNLLGAVLFYEYRTDDARLTIEIIKEAVMRGAIALNYLKAVSCIYEEEKLRGMKACDVLDGKEFEIKAKYIVNACGPWVDELNDLEKAKETHKLQLTKGVHIVVDQTCLPIKQAMYFDTPDKRMIFIIPREGKIYIGTTDTFYMGEIAQPVIEKQEVHYLLNCVNNFFPGKQMDESMIESGWAGIRPLIKKEGKGPSEISRKDEMFVSKSGMIIIAGGKLTGYRKMAERVTNYISQKLKHEKGILPCTTHKIKISGGKLPENMSYKNFCRYAQEKGSEHNLSLQETELLLGRYGSNIETLFLICENLKKEDHPLPLVLRAQIHYCIKHEMCLNATDFFLRRTGMTFFDKESVMKWGKETELYFAQLTEPNANNSNEA